MSDLREFSAQPVCYPSARINLHFVAYMPLRLIFHHIYERRQTVSLSGDAIKAEILTRNEPNAKIGNQEGEQERD